MTSVRLLYGVQEQAVLVSNDGTVHPLDIARFKKYYGEVQEIPDVDLPPQSAIHTVKLTAPIDLLNTGLQIIDTPGLDTTGHQTPFLAEAIGILLVINAKRPLSTSETQFLDSWAALKSPPALFLVVNFINEVPVKERDEIKEWLSQALAPYLQHQTPAKGPLFYTGFASN